MPSRALNLAPPPPTVDYHAPSHHSPPTADPLLAYLAATLSAAAGAMVAWGCRHGWHTRTFYVLSAIAAAALALRAARLCQRAFYRTSWISAVIAFAAWTTLLLANQFHGQSPPSSRYLIACTALACAFAAIGLAFDTRPSPNEAIRWHARPAARLSSPKSRVSPPIGSSSPGSTKTERAEHAEHVKDI